MNEGLTVIIEDLKKLGLNEYESKAYLKLLEYYPVNGYTLSKNSGIPRSRIYEVLESLKKKQLVLEQSDGKGMLYQPLEPRLLITRMKENYQGILNRVDQYTTEVYSEKQIDNKLVVIKGRNQVIDFLRYRILQAEKRIAVSIWDEEINELSEPLEKALKRGVVLRGILFGKNNRFDDLVIHRRISRYLSEKKERHMIVAIDGLHVIYGIISRGENSQVSWTTDRCLVGMSEDNIVHDVMANRYSNHLTENKRKEYEDYFDVVRKDFFGFSTEEFLDF